MRGMTPWQRAQGVEAEDFEVEDQLIAHERGAGVIGQLRPRRSGKHALDRGEAVGNFCKLEHFAMLLEQRRGLRRFIRGEFAVSHRFQKLRMRRQQAGRIYDAR